MEPVPPDAAGRQEPCDLHPGLQQRPTRRRIALGEPVIRLVPRVRIRPGELHFRDIRYRFVQFREAKDLPGRVDLSRIEAEPTRHLGVQRPAGHDRPRATFETGPEGRHLEGGTDRRRNRIEDRGLPAAIRADQKGEFANPSEGVREVELERLRHIPECRKFSIRSFASFIAEPRLAPNRPDQIVEPGYSTVRMPWRNIGSREDIACQAEIQLARFQQLG